MTKFFKNNKGFTMVELIIVIAIIAVLAAVLAPQYLRFVEDSRESTDVDKANAIESAVNVLVADGTMSTGGTVTWAPFNGTLTASAGGADLLAQLNTTSGSPDLTATSDNATTAFPTATDVITFYIVEDASGFITVKAVDGTSTTPATAALYDFSNEWLD